ncbi:unnamed protein product [Trichogramma brassicae]|uniref:Uncharacterized protein n=1 Tax=Trichogramma brassicae TaxID=86971 RepID=A0A6H5I0V8_9HYME|nr:unnamed protein product [Trichogramma brassicae]
MGVTGLPCTPTSQTIFVEQTHPLPYYTRAVELLWGPDPEQYINRHSRSLRRQ